MDVGRNHRGARFWDRDSTREYEGTVCQAFFSQSETENKLIYEAKTLLVPHSPGVALLRHVAEDKQPVSQWVSLKNEKRRNVEKNSISSDSFEGRLL